MNDQQAAAAQPAPAVRPVAVGFGADGRRVYYAPFDPDAAGWPCGHNHTCSASGTSALIGQLLIAMVPAPDAASAAAFDAAARPAAAWPCTSAPGSETRTGKTRPTTLAAAALGHRQLVELIGSGGGETQAAAYDLLKAEYGEEEAAARWEKAAAELDHATAVEHCRKELAEAMAIAADALSTARRNVGKLTDPRDAWHRDYAETSAGADLLRILEFAAFQLRMAIAVNDRTSKG